MAGAIAQSADGFLERLEAGRIPRPLTTLGMADVGLTASELWQLFETQLKSRRLDLESRRLATQGKSFYSIGSSGHEGNAAVARVFRRDDIAFLHYRSGAFLIERARKLPGTTPLWDMALSFAASSEDPISGGRHKVLGSAPLFIPPQTSTIASHLPKAVGAAWSIDLARHQRRASVLPHDSVAICSFGDASSNHSTAQGAFNSAAWTAYRKLPMPLVFVCEDNGIGISVPTPESWVQQNFAHRPGLEYIAGDARDICDAIRAAGEAERFARARRRPVFLHLRTVRLMGHAGSDVEMQYRTRDDIEREADQDPLLHTARHLIEHAGSSLHEIGATYARITDQVLAVMDQAAGRPKLTSSAEVIAPLAPQSEQGGADRPQLPSPTQKPQHMSRAISATLAQQMERDDSIIVFGEDVGRKGGVYGATTGLQKQFGQSRVFDTLLDEQTILGLAIGAAHNGYLPIPEIQFLAYVHNAEDQIRGEAATLSFFSDAQYANPMVIRIAGLAYQKGFGGHFHNDNAIGVFRDIPGIVLVCPSCASEAVLLLREAIRLAREERRVVVFLEPIALYNVKDLHEAGDGKMLGDLSGDEPPARFGEVQVFAAAQDTDLTIITYGNGTYFARRCQERLAKQGVHAEVMDLRWLLPLPMDDVLQRLDVSKPIVIVDECRKTGSLSEELIAHLTEAGITAPIRRVTGDDSFIPLGPAANEVLLQESDIMAAALDIAGKGH